MSTAQKRRPRERIGGDEARRWARSLDLGNPYAKSIMLAAANYMNEEGTAYPGTSTLARDTDISEDTVVKRLRWLAEIGAIALFKCWRDENGQRNYEGRGKPTSSEIRFLFDADVEEIRARAHGESFGDDARETSEISPRHQRGLNEEAQPPASPRLAPDQPPKSDPSESPVHMNARARLEQELESQPQTPSDEGAFAASTSSVEKQDDRLDEFAAVYPIPITDFEKTRIVWQGLSDDERADAITGAKGYADLCRKQPSRNREDAHRWLRGRKWQGYLAAGKQAEAAAEWCEIDEGSEDWNDWVLFYRCCGKRGFPEFMLTGTEPKRKARVRGRKPPIVGIDPSAEWRKVVERTGPFAAWLRRLTELPNAPIQFGNEAQPGGLYLKTLTVPSEWPPGKGQSSAA